MKNARVNVDEIDEQQMIVAKSKELEEESSSR